MKVVNLIVLCVLSLLWPPAAYRMMGAIPSNQYAAQVRRRASLERLAHEANKQRQGGYWAQSGYHKKRERPMGRGGPVIVHERFKQRWIYR